ncbi:MAG: alpha-ketoglutarate-dependent dioxygenase AlkB [Gammaproteobacteria bacterium]|nr:alpha-ketoglutarate-dependent dioxygenase AlkB [Gammaproteobacteria bacterium]
MTTAELPLPIPGGENHAKVDRSDRKNPLQQRGASANEGRATDWLGLETDHRRLFEAGQDEWLHPCPSGFVLGRGCFVAEPHRIENRNIVAVRLAFDEKKLPLFQNTKQDIVPVIESLSKQDDAPVGTRWVAPIPLYAVMRLEVISSEEKARLHAMAGQISNVSLPDIEITVGATKVFPVPTQESTIAHPSHVELPETLNAVHGAMAMAVWAVPRVDPWIDTLQSALNLDAEETTRKIMDLDVQWLHVPWLHDHTSASCNPEATLWRAALATMRSPSTTGMSPAQVAEMIARHACNEGAGEMAKDWLDHTRRIVAAEGSFSPDATGAGLAIQLVLLRPEPVDFKAWSRDLPWLPPATWWAASVLCGWRHGYRALDKRFRGDAAFREFLTTHALKASWPSDISSLLPTMQQEKLEWQREDDCFSMNWGGHPIIQKQWHPRGKWYQADFADKTVAKSAREIASKLEWPCLKRRISLTETRVPVRGKGNLSIDVNQELMVTGRVALYLPEGVQVEEEVDPDEFRRELVRRAGEVSDPPKRSLPQPVDMDIPGLIYCPHFISRDEELELIERIDRGAWSKSLARRVQQYGWRYDYRQRKLDAAMRLGELPDWGASLARRLVDEGLIDAPPDQMIVNEYLGDQGITKHIDHPSFAEQVATISLLETWGMVFRLRDRKIEKPLEHGSVAVLTGEARYEWTHEIPKRKSEPGGEGRKRVKRGRRVSLTFRKTKVA